MLRTLRLLIAVTFLLNVSLACDENQADQLNERQDFDGYQYMSNPWNPYYYNYQTGTPEFRGTFESRTPSASRPYNYYVKSGEEDKNLPADSRFFGVNTASFLNNVLFNNRFTTPTNPFRPFAGLSNQLPVTVNPNFANPLYESCTAPSGESGVCASGSVCSLFGGRPSGSCSRARVCCINAITTCGGSVTLNNTYWQSPSTAVASPSSCSLTVKLDTSFVEQKRAICQVRLDLFSFSIAQPEATSVCVKDTFQVGGATTTPPTICGDNNGQHMYIEVPPSNTNPSDLQLLFNFGSTTTSRSWNIKISMLPCGASYLAPPDCLQYFTTTSGKVSSFNWKNVALAAGVTRQLANQNYNICFRTELVNSQKAAKMCLSPCTDTTATSFSSLSGSDGAAKIGTVNCAADYILFPDGKDSGAVLADRYCGGTIASTPICSTMKPFKIAFSTNGDEGTGMTADDKNVGFCLNFTEQ